MKVRGRPKKFNETAVVSFNMEKKLFDELSSYCKKNAIERSSLINKMIKELLKKDELN